MDETKIKELNQRFMILQDEIDKAIFKNLKRLNRTVTMGELGYIPFREDIQPYVDAIKINEENNVLFETCFSDVKEKRLEAFVMDYEMSVDDLLLLLNYLSDILD